MSDTQSKKSYYTTGRRLAAVLTAIGWAWLIGSLFAVVYTALNKVSGGAHYLFHVVASLCTLLLCHTAKAAFDLAER